MLVRWHNIISAVGSPPDVDGQEEEALHTNVEAKRQYPSSAVDRLKARTAIVWHRNRSRGCGQVNRDTKEALRYRLVPGDRAASRVTAASVIGRSSVRSKLERRLLTSGVSGRDPRTNNTATSCPASFARPPTAQARWGPPRVALFPQVQDGQPGQHSIEAAEAGVLDCMLQRGSTISSHGCNACNGGVTLV